jgi:hypothetical protein
MGSPSSSPEATPQHEGAFYRRKEQEGGSKITAL